MLEKNADAIALRPGLQGNYREAEQLLHHRVSTGRLGVENRAHTIPEWASMLRETGWGIVECAGVRLFSDVAPDDLPGDEFEALLSLEREAGGIESYRSVSRLVHIWAE